MYQGAGAVGESITVSCDRYRPWRRPALVPGRSGPGNESHSRARPAARAEGWKGATMAPIPVRRIRKRGEGSVPVQPENGVGLRQGGVVPLFAQRRLGGSAPVRGALRWQS